MVYLLSVEKEEFILKWDKIKQTMLEVLYEDLDYSESPLSILEDIEQIKQMPDSIEGDLIEFLEIFSFRDLPAILGEFLLISAKDYDGINRDLCDGIRNNCESYRRFDVVK